MRPTTRALLPLALGFAAAAAFAVPAVFVADSAYAHGGGGGGGTGSGGGHSGGSSGGGHSGGTSGGKTGGTGGKTGGPNSGGPKSKANTSNAKGRGDYLEQMQHDEDDDLRPTFLDDATNDVVRSTRSAERLE